MLLANYPPYTRPTPKSKPSKSPISKELIVTSIVTIIPFESTVTVLSIKSHGMSNRINRINGEKWAGKINSV